MFRFRIQFQHLKVYCNEERTRTFIGLKVNSGMTQQLDAISKRLDTVLKEYRLPEFYKVAKFSKNSLFRLPHKICFAFIAGSVISL